MKEKELFGWYGLFAVLIGYFFVSFDFLEFSSYTYLTLNITGSLALASISFQKKSYSLGGFYLIWALIGFFTFTKILIF